jgi:hypothetical protein
MSVWQENIMPSPDNQIANSARKDSKYFLDFNDGGDVARETQDFASLLV